MSTQTANYGLQKDATGDSYDVGVVNANLDKIDAAIYAAANRYYVNAAASDDYTITMTGVTSYTDLLGKILLIKATIANTTAATLNVSGLGAKAIVRGTATALLTGDIPANKVIAVVYDGTSFQMLSQGADVSTASKTETLSGKTLTAPKFVNAGFIADANGNEQMCFYTTASAVNCVSLTNAATANNPSFAASGDDTNVGLDFKSKAAGLLRFFVNGAISFIVDGVASAVNYLKITGAIAGAHPKLEAAGSDTNISLLLVSKGTGTVQANGAKVATVSSTVTATLAAASWTGATAPYSITVAVAGVTTTSNQDMMIASTAAVAAYDAFGKAKIIEGSQAANSVTLSALGTKPAVDIPVKFVIRGDV